MLTLQTLVSCVKQDVLELPEKMNLESDAVIVNQCDKNEYTNFKYKDLTIKVYHMEERGVGLSRNTAMLHSSADIILFSDEDIVYEKGYKERIIKEFEARKEADILIFNMDVAADRATYFTKEEKEVHQEHSLLCGVG